MTPEEILQAAVEKKTPAERNAFLEGACGQDAALRAEVEGLLQAHEAAGSFLEEPLFEPQATLDQPSSEGVAQPGTVIGPYKLLEQIGEGGMGTVWMAQQTEPVKRVVAVKLIKAGMDSKQVIARFEAERQALALMDHPNIARVLDGGTTKGEPGGVSPGRPYFVMDLVKGVPITRYCDEHHVTPRQRLELFIPVCQAIQHAHQKGIIHRDLKPSNVLVALYDGTPVPKVIDFGVAKAAGQSLTDKTLVTSFGAIVGTLEYMSPEQAEINQLDIDTRSDIYSLGVLLYELLAGSPPFTRKDLEKAGMLEMLRVIREQEPSKPSTKLSTAEGLPTLAANRGTEPAKLTKLVRGELDWIVMKALEKDRNRRYESANGFAMDVQRYLADEQVLACPPSAWYRFRKFARRNKLALSATFLVAAALVVAVATLIVSNIRIRHEKERAEEGFRQARQAVDDYFTQVSENKLLDVPGLQPLRKELLETALRYYHGFVQQHGNDPAVRTELAKVYYRVGVITIAIGSKEEALAALEKARAIQEERVRGNPADAPLRADLAASYGKLGETLYALGRVEEALRQHERARDRWEELLREQPGNPEWLSGLATAHAQISDRQFDFGQEHETLQSAERSLQIREQLWRRRPDDLQFQNDLADSHMSVGALYAGTDRAGLALRSQEKAWELREQLVRANPAVLRFQYDFAQSCFALGWQYGRMQQPEKALHAYQQARSALEKLVRANPGVTEFQFKLAQCLYCMGTVQQALQRQAEAIRSYELAKDLTEALLPTAPESLLIQFVLARVQICLGRLKARAGDQAEGLRLLQSAQERCEKLVHDHPRLPHLQIERAQSLWNLGDFFYYRGRREEADRAYRKARASLEQMAQDVPGPAYEAHLAKFLVLVPDARLRDLGRARELAEKVIAAQPEYPASWSILGTARYRTGEYQGAILALKKAEQLRKQDAPVDWLFLAMAHAKLGQPDQARPWYDRAVQWGEKNEALDESYRTTRTEAAEVLGIPEQKK